MSDKPWRKCAQCSSSDSDGPVANVFTSPNQFGDHLRLVHSTVDGQGKNGSRICQFGPNGTCVQFDQDPSGDYETHVAKCHIFAFNNASVSNNHVASNNHLKNASKPPATENNIKNHYVPYRRKEINFPTPAKNSDFDHYLNDSEANNQAKESHHSNGLHDWNVHCLSQNLTSVLNDPNKPRSYYDNLFTKEWGFIFVEPSVISSYPTSKKASTMLFEPYISRVSKRPKKTRASTKCTIREIAPTPPSFAQSIIPALFFDDNFDLDQSDTFAKLLTLFTPADDPDQSLEIFFDQQSMMSTQKLLSEYLDLVEQDLSQQIGKRSKDFFQVMSSMDLVMEKLKLSIRQVTNIRQDCSTLEQNLVFPIQRNIASNRLREKYKDVFRKINWIATVHQTQPTIQLLLSKNDYAGALDLISTSQEVVTQELSGVISFR